MTEFFDMLREWPPERVRDLLEGSDCEQAVERALARPVPEAHDFAALLSPAAALRLEPMARRAAALTRQRFGHVLQFYAPLYVSNHCVNSCRYCGFNRRNRVQRRCLTIDEAVAEATVLAEQGFRHILLVSGEDRKAVPVDYFTELTVRLRQLFASIAIEIYPLAEAGYRRLVEAGVDSLTLYQETYLPDLYSRMHPDGPKRDFRFRLESVERAARAGVAFLGIGALLGLADWRVDGFYVGLHARWLLRNYWRQQVSVSFPRLRQASGALIPPCPVDDRAFVQLMIAQRLFLPDAGLVLSTREDAELRDRLIPLAVTRLSAGSKTTPGGYANEADGEPQFEVQDHRSLAAMHERVRQLGFDPVDKDWDCAYHSP